MWRYELMMRTSKKTIRPQSSIAVDFIFLDLERGGSGGPLPVQKVEKKPGLYTLTNYITLILPYQLKSGK